MTVVSDLVAIQDSVTELSESTAALLDAVSVRKAELDDAVSASGAAAQDAEGARSATETARDAAQAAQSAAEDAAASAASVRTGGTATLTPEAGKIPLADANGVIVSGWLDAMTSATDRTDGRVVTAGYLDQMVWALETLADLRSADTSVYGHVIQVLGRTTAGDGYGGIFDWISGDQSANVSADPQNGIWVAPSSGYTTNPGDNGAWKRRYDNHVYVKWFGAVENQPSADAIQAAINTVLVKGFGTVYIDGDFPIEKPINIGPRQNPSARNGWVNIEGNGGRIYKHSTFNGDRLVNIKLDSFDEEYLSISNLFIDGVDETVNGVDWFDDSVAYNALRAEHAASDSSYAKGIVFNAVSLERCYRGLRHSGNATRFYGCIFRLNICGEFRVEASNDVAFFGCSFRRNQFGSHIATSDPARTSVGAVYSGCIWENNSVVGVFNQGGGNQTFVNPYFESNGKDLSDSDYLDKISSLDTISTNFYQSGVAGFAAYITIISGQSVGTGATTGDIYAPWAKRLTVMNFRGSVHIGNPCDDFVYHGVVEPTLISPAEMEGQEYIVNNEKRIIVNNVSLPVSTVGVFDVQSDSSLELLHSQRTKTGHFGKRVLINSYSAGTQTDFATFTLGANNIKAKISVICQGVNSGGNNTHGGAISIEGYLWKNRQDGYFNWTETVASAYKNWTAKDTLGGSNLGDLFSETSVLQIGVSIENKITLTITDMVNPSVSQYGTVSYIEAICFIEYEAYDVDDSLLVKTVS